MKFSGKMLLNIKRHTKNNASLSLSKFEVKDNFLRFPSFRFWV